MAGNMVVALYGAGFRMMHVPTWCITESVTHQFGIQMYVQATINGQCQYLHVMLIQVWRVGVCKWRRTMSGITTVWMKSSCSTKVAKPTHGTMTVTVLRTLGMLQTVHWLLHKKFTHLLTGQLILIWKLACQTNWLQLQLTKTTMLKAFAQLHWVLKTNNQLHTHQKLVWSIHHWTTYVWHTSQLSLNTLLVNHGSVSYTHLDVYKRQI